MKKKYLPFAFTKWSYTWVVIVILGWLKEKGLHSQILKWRKLHDSNFERKVVTISSINLHILFAPFLDKIDCVGIASSFNVHLRPGHLSFTQVFPRVKRCLSKTGKNWVKPLFFPINRIILPIVWNKRSAHGKCPGSTYYSNQR